MNKANNTQGLAFPSGEIKLIQGKSISLKGNDIDTDRIIPARYLKCVNFENLSKGVFADDRKELEGKHPFDLKINQGALILIVNNNFGCGSSREHAPQALMRWGIRCIIGESFAEIFSGNCLALGIPCATTSKSNINLIQAIIEKEKHRIWKLDLLQEKLFLDEKFWALDFEKTTLERLKNGKWDATSLLVSNSNKVLNKKMNLPYLNNYL